MLVATPHAIKPGTSGGRELVGHDPTALLSYLVCTQASNYHDRRSTAAAVFASIGAKLLSMSSDASKKNLVRASEDVDAISRKLCLTPQEVDVHQLIDDFVLKVCYCPCWLIIVCQQRFDHAGVR